MSTLDARIMQFLSRKQVQFPELKQPSVVLYQTLASEDSHMNEREQKTFKKAITSPLHRALYTA